MKNTINRGVSIGLTSTTPPPEDKSVVPLAGERFALAIESISRQRRR